MKELVELLKQKQLRICSCESLTAGLFASTLARIAGASNVLQGALVTYQNEIKERVALVDHEIIERYGVISAQCASAMADNTKLIMQADIAVSFTGNAGPSAMEGKPAGLVYCAIAGPSGIVVYEFRLALKRNALREELVDRMCQNVISYILSIE